MCPASEDSPVYIPDGDSSENDLCCRSGNQTIVACINTYSLVNPNGEVANAFTSGLCISAAIYVSVIELTKYTGLYSRSLFSFKVLVILVWLTVNDEW